VNIDYISNELWPKLGFLPIDPENPALALIAEYMLNELIFKNSNDFEELNLQHLKELFGADDEDLEDDPKGMEGMDEGQSQRDEDDEYADANDSDIIVS
jgi:hypothetical protein